ncbi:MAG: hypothetical protein OXU74_06635 [Gemmatimonadota bacterium]|nr:hypothetical protein [Gemmatimonadota bacterium]
MQDTTRLLDMADFLDGLPNGRNVHAGDDAVDMSVWRCSVRSKRPGCGTVGCIAGHTVLRYDGTAKMPRMGWGARAAFLLGFCTEQEYGRALFARKPTKDADVERRVGVVAELFHPVQRPSDAIEIDGSQCATVMRAVAEHADAITAADVAGLWRRAIAG